MTLLTSVSPRPSASSGGFRQVLAVVDLDAPVEPVVRRAVATSFAHGIPLQVVVLHPRLPFTTDPALAARAARRLGQEQRRAAAAVTAAAQDSGLADVPVRLVPLSRMSLSRRGQARRTVAAQLRRQPPSLLVAAEQHTPDAEVIPADVRSEPSADLRSSVRGDV